MENLAAMRITLIIVIFLAVGFGFVAGMYWSFPFNAGGVTLAVAAMGGAGYFVSKAEKRTRFNAFYAAIRNFGTPLSFGNYSAVFERNGTRFDITYPRGENESALKIKFFLTGNHQRFIIRHQGIFLHLLPDCPNLPDSPLSPNVQLYAQNAEFLRRFVQIPVIRDEIYEYPSGFLSRMAITFDGGSFELLWTPKMNEQAEGVYKICKTAVVFHDELKKSR